MSDPQTSHPHQQRPLLTDFPALSLADVAFRKEDERDQVTIEAIHDIVFGPGRFARAASVIREQGPHDPALSFVALYGDLLLGSVRMTPIDIGGRRGHQLGPLAVVTARRKLGVGKHLVNIAVDAARRAGSDFVLLVGDAPYYWPMGFRAVSTERIGMPLPVAPDRLLVCSFAASTLGALEGRVQHANSALRMNVSGSDSP